MGLIQCPDCGNQYPPTAALCPQCGHPQSVDEEAKGPQTIALSDTKLAGTVIGNRYRLDKMVGRGGMAVVYRGTHLQLEQQVAIKIVYRHLAMEPEIQQRFRTEAQIQFTLQHPGVVRVIDLIDELDFLGMTMDWIEGDTLHKWLRKRTEPPTADDILRFYEPLLKAVGYAHSRNVIHRDIKPGNILLQDIDGKLMPKITDFGIAKILDDRSGFQTQMNAALGTPTYMSPEQVEGMGEIDHRADIYSLGVLLFCLATGRPPFKGKTTIETANAHLTAPVPPLQQVYQFADLRLEPVIQRALAKSPIDRFDSCETFLEALQDALSVPSAADFQTVANLSLDLGDAAKKIAKDWYGNKDEQEPAPASSESPPSWQGEPHPGEPSPSELPNDDLDTDEPEVDGPTHDEMLDEDAREELLDTTTEEALVEMPLVVGREVAVVGRPTSQLVGESLPKEEEFAHTIADTDNMLETMLQARLEARIQGKEKKMSAAEIQQAKAANRKKASAKDTAMDPKARGSKSNSTLLAVLLLVLLAGLAAAIWHFWPR